MANSTSSKDWRPEDVDAHLQQILASRYFSPDSAHEKVLRYLVARTLNDPADRVTERQIGVAALGRSADYDPQTDSVARAVVSRVRDKLAQYYSEAGTETLQFEIPRGSFDLAVRVLNEPESVSAPKARVRSSFRWAILLASLALVAGTLIGHFLVPPRIELHGGAALTQAGKPDPEMMWLWGPVLDHPQIQLVVSRRVFLASQSAFLRVPRLDFLQSPAQRQKMLVWQSKLDDGELRLDRSYTSHAEAIAAIELACYLQKAGRDFILTDDGAVRTYHLKNAGLVTYEAARTVPALRSEAERWPYRGMGRSIQPVHVKRIGKFRGKVLIEDPSVPIEDFVLITRMAGGTSSPALLDVAGTSNSGIAYVRSVCLKSEFAGQWRAELRRKGTETAGNLQILFRVRYNAGIPAALQIVDAVAW